MVNARDSAATNLDGRDFNVAALARTASWGIAAATALLLAVLAGLSGSGAQRVAAAVSALSGSQATEAAAIAPVVKPPPAAVVQPPPQRSQFMAEARRLNEQVRLLAADRDRLIQRVAQLERDLEDVTGSIRRQEASARMQAESVELSEPAAAIAMATAVWPPVPPQQPATAPWNEPASPAPAHEAAPSEAASEIVTGALSSPTAPASTTPLPPPRPASPLAAETHPSAESPPAGPATPREAAGTAGPEARRTTYGVDLGGAASLNRLRMLWQSLSTSESRLLEGLRPVTHVRAIRRGGRPDVRLIAGPLAGADHAARLCAAILDTGRFCEPAVFHGHRLR